MGQTFGRYILLKKIGVGGMAVVHKAKLVGAKGFNKSVAIKMTQPHLSSDPSFVQAFEAEAKLASLLDHPNVVQVLDFGAEKDIYYLAMEYVWGKDLRTVLNESKQSNTSMSNEYAAFVISSVCQGLDYAHNLKDTGNQSLNLVHRDISPQNVLISYGGDIKVVDFGIAKIATSTQHTQVGLIKGKVSYMSPEQTMGTPLDRRSDLFAVGIVFYELLAGKNPFQTEDNILTLDKIRKAEYTPLAQAGVNVSGSIEKIIAKCLAKDPDARYQTAKELQNDIDNYLHGLNTRVSREDIGKFMSQTFADEKKQDESERSKEDTAVQKGGTTIAKTPVPPPPPNKKTGNFSGLNLKMVLGAGIGVLALLFVLYQAIIPRGGIIKIETSPKQVAILLDGKKVGDSSPITLEDVKIGDKHEIAVTAKGYKNWTKTFVLGEDERSFDIELEPDAFVALRQPVSEPEQPEPEPSTPLSPPISEPGQETVTVPPVAVVAKTGQLEIKAIDARSGNSLDALVQVNRKSKGSAPVTLSKLDMSERLSVSIEKKGYKSVSEKIVFSESDKAKLFKSVTFKLTRQTGTLKIVAQDGKGPFEISLNGLSIGSTPIERGNLPLGRAYRVVAQATGYKRYSRSVSLEGPETSIVVVQPERLQPPPLSVTPPPKPPKIEKLLPPPAPPTSKKKLLGQFSINTRPWSEVFINGKSIGITPIGKYDLKAGTHKIEMVNSRRELTKEGEITIESGKELKKFFNLEDE